MNEFKTFRKDKIVELSVLVLAILSLALSFSFINGRSIGGILNSFLNIKVNITLVSLTISAITLVLSYKLNPNSYIVRCIKIISALCIGAIILFTMTTVLFAN